MRTSTIQAIPVYRALTIAGNVLERDADGEVHHHTVSTTTAAVVLDLQFEIKPQE